MTLLKLCRLWYSFGVSIERDRPIERYDFAIMENYGYRGWRLYGILDYLATSLILL